MKLLIAGALGLATLTAAPAAAVTYDAFTYFNGAPTAGPFTFGTGVNGDFTPYPAGGTCLFTTTICVTAGDYLGVYKTGDGLPHQDGTVAVPSDALILHPGANGQLTTILFTAPTTANYSLTLQAFQADNVNPNSVNIIGSNPFFSFQLAQLTTASPTFFYSENNIFLNAGDSIGLSVEYDGNYQFDSTGINFTISAVPEPASWALMIVGFGLVGATMRRRLTIAA